MLRGDEIAQKAFSCSTLFLFAIVAHKIAGGHFVAFDRLCLESVVVLAATFLSKESMDTGPGLALQILLIQSSSHFILGSGTYESQLRMSASHACAGLLSYLLISKFSAMWNFIFLLGRKAFIPHLIPLYVEEKPGLTQVFAYEGIYFFDVAYESIKRRGPPSKELAHAS